MKNLTSLAFWFPRQIHNTHRVYFWLHLTHTEGRLKLILIKASACQVLLFSQNFTFIWHENKVQELGITCYRTPAFVRSVRSSENVQYYYCSKEKRHQQLCRGKAKQILTYQIFCHDMSHVCNQSRNALCSFRAQFRITWHPTEN